MTLGHNLNGHLKFYNRFMNLNKFCLFILLITGSSCTNNQSFDSHEDFFVVIKPALSNYLEIRLVPKGKSEALFSRSGYCYLTIEGDKNTPSFAGSSVGKIFSNGSGQVYELYQCIPSKDKVPKFFSHSCEISYFDEVLVQVNFDPNEQGEYDFKLRVVCCVVTIDQTSFHTSDSKIFVTNFSIDKQTLFGNKRIIIDPEWYLEPSS